jgi:signal peptidase I
MAKAPTPIRGPGKYTLTFANVDDRLCLWVNDSWMRDGLIPFGTDAAYSSPENRRPQDADLAPVGLAAKGIAAKVTDLVVERDIYYRAESVDTEEYDPFELPNSMHIQDLLYNPSEYGEYYANNGREVTFRQLRDDEFFVMGDNSPRSQDSRLWPNKQRHAYNRHGVPRAALMGKAFFIYWPHGIPFLNNGNGYPIKYHSVYRNDQGHSSVETYPEYVVPFYPQWWRWKRIR